MSDIYIWLVAAVVWAVFFWWVLLAYRPRRPRRPIIIRFIPSEPSRRS
jgi:hypothetical protein